MIRNWSKKEIQDQLDRIVWAATDPRQDGFTTWAYKQDLYLVRFMVEDALARCSTYEGEKEWLEEQRIEREKKQVWKTLTK